MKSVLFYPQNETHLENMLPVVQYLEQVGVSVAFFDTSNVYHQHIYANYDGLNLIKPDIVSSNPFYLASLFTRVKVIRAFKAVIKNLSHYDCLVIGNDGALQRVLHNSGKFSKTVFMVDAIINDNTFSFFDLLSNPRFFVKDLKTFLLQRIRLAIVKSCKRLKWNHYLPSEIGLIQPHLTFVMGDYVKKVLVGRGLKEENIRSFGLPRFRSVFQNQHIQENHSSKVFEVMTLTQSAVWHNDKVKEEIQVNQIFKLINLIDELRRKTKIDIRLNIRLHPRDKTSDRSYFFEKSFVKPIKGDLYPQLLSSDLLVATTSTVLVEHLAMKGRVAVIMLEAQWWRYKRSFLSLDCFDKYHSIPELENLIVSLVNGENMVPGSIDSLISENCKDSPKLISTEILKLLEE